MHRYPGAWPEARTGVVKLNGVDLATLEVYKYWLQTGTIEDTDTLLLECSLPLRSDGMLSQGRNKLRSILVGNVDRIYVTPAKADRLDQLVRCWIFADYIGAPAFQNDLMDAILNLYAELHYEDYALPLYNIPFICKNASSGVPLRAFIIDSIYSCLSGKTLKKMNFLKLIPKDLAIAVAVLPWVAANLTVVVVRLGKEVSASIMCTQMGSLMLLARTRLHGMGGARKSYSGILL